jgi:hypothetical protein
MAAIMYAFEGSFIKNRLPHKNVTSSNVRCVAQAKNLSFGYPKEVSSVVNSWLYGYENWQ